MVSRAPPRKRPRRHQSTGTRTSTSGRTPRSTRSDSSFLDDCLVRRVLARMTAIPLHRLHLIITDVIRRFISKQTQSRLVRKEAT